MMDVTIVILVGNEERHIARCLDKLVAFEAQQIVVIDSDSKDQTEEILFKKVKS